METLVIQDSPSYPPIEPPRLDFHHKGEQAAIQLPGGSDFMFEVNDANRTLLQVADKLGREITDLVGRLLVQQARLATIVAEQRDVATTPLTRSLSQQVTAYSDSCKRVSELNDYISRRRLEYNAMVCAILQYEVIRDDNSALRDKVQGLIDNAGTANPIAEQYRLLLIISAGPPGFLEWMRSNNFINSEGIVPCLTENTIINMKIEFSQGGRDVAQFMPTEKLRPIN